MNDSLKKILEKYIKMLYKKDPRTFVSEFVREYTRTHNRSPPIPEVYSAGRRSRYERDEIRIGLIEHISGQRFDPGLHLRA